AILAVGMLIVVTPLSLIFRHRPEQYGYQLDGLKEAPTPSTARITTSPPTELKIGLVQALKSITFWRIAATYMVHATIISSVITHVMPYLSSIGIARTRAGLVAMAIPIISVGGRLGFGWLADKRDRRRVIAGTFGMVTLGLVCLAYAPTAGFWLLIPFLFLFGIGYGGITTLRPSLVSEYFGRSNFGTVFGFIVGINALGGIAGPWLAGWVYDTWGSYQGIWLTYAGLAVIAMPLIFNISRVKMPLESGSGVSKGGVK
ncbi:MAG TPA: MFS transporter, partial [Dehalococcoidales bacterium]|nr:MFS transporter [Dehalococcoidales bacterium]